MKGSLLFLFLCFFISFSIRAQDTKDPGTFDPTFTHVVYFWLKNPENAQERNHFETSLKTLFKESKYTRTNFLGTPPKATREVVEDSFTYAMIVTFESAEAQMGYQKETAHLNFIEKTKHLLEKFIVYDATGLNP